MLSLIQDIYIYITDFHFHWIITTKGTVIRAGLPRAVVCGS